jgi:predicted metal-dependent hydrolase
VRQAVRLETITIGGRKVEYRVRHSKAARKLRVRVGPNGVEVVQPVGRDDDELAAFVHSSADWIVGQLERVERLRHVRKPERLQAGELLYRGDPTRVRIEQHPYRRGANRVFHEDGDILEYLPQVTGRLGQRPAKIYIMGQRTK